MLSTAICNGSLRLQKNHELHIAENWNTKEVPLSTHYVAKIHESATIQTDFKSKTIPGCTKNLR